MSLGVNYGAFSITTNASLTGIMWRTVMKKEHLSVIVGESALLNLPLMTAALMIACSVLVGQVYVARGVTVYDS
jgi:tetrahydromethanopterin S-methyltransferase subunit D